MIIVFAPCTGLNSAALQRPYRSTGHPSLGDDPERRFVLPLEVRTLPIGTLALVEIPAGSDENFNGFELQHIARETDSATR